jgi:hypothetical protein
MTFINVSKPHPHNLESWALAERAKRITALVEKPRCMTVAAATTVVDAAMFGIGCIARKSKEELECQEPIEKS